MKAHLASALSGVLFGVGLAISGMTRPEKVIGFLDVFGKWDASLAFVMGGAVAVHFFAHRLVRGRSSPLFDTVFHLPTRTSIDKRLLAGATIFGVGWGLGGFCPGPGLVSAAGGAWLPIVFVVGMTIGILVEAGALRRFSGAEQRRQP
ncbi:MAG: hypothetical protein JST00_38750 [Deltaproteobacteria bacterium]|nr:hypothetical protein [Deltaproteobacteria bacterium]